MAGTPSYGLAPYGGPFERTERMHLLRRCLFGVSPAEYRFFENRDLEGCLDVLLTPSPFKKMIPQEDTELEDPLVPKGQQWVDAPYENSIIDQRRRAYLKSWWVGQLLDRDSSLTEKMVLFLHNHFVTEMDAVGDARYSYRYVQLLRRHALGNYKNFIREGSTDLAMLVYLNGNTNTKTAPNENYSRELMELFTLGKENGPAYTEADVQAAARVLSGWKDDKTAIRTVFVSELHDTEDKTFSAFFGHKTIQGKTGAAGAGETDELVDMLFEKTETARFVCRNLYRWFVAGSISDRAETEIIAPLADVFVKNGFALAPTLRILLASEHFFAPDCRGCIVKSPVDFFVGVSRQLEVEMPPIPLDKHLCWIHYNYYLGGLSQFIGDPPSVAGWPAYHQAPKYHQWWVNSYTLGFRKKIVESLASPEGMNCNGPRIGFDFVAFVERFAEPSSAKRLLADCLAFLFAVPVPPVSQVGLFRILAGNDTSGREWQTVWNAYKANPRDSAIRTRIENRLRLFFEKMFNLPEYQML